MIKKLLIFLFLALFFYTSAPLASAVSCPGSTRDVGCDCQNTTECVKGLLCQPDSDPSNPNTCQLPTGVVGVFGVITPPKAIQSLGFGSAGINKFLNSLIFLIYALAAVVFTFMLLWGAVEWTMSGGDKEKLESAQTRITNALIGIVLFALVVAIMDLVSRFTGFKFFNN